MNDDIAIHIGARVAKSIYSLENKRLRQMLQEWDPPLVAEALRAEIKELHERRFLFQEQERIVSSEITNAIRIMSDELARHREWAESRRPKGIAGRIQAFLFGEQE